MNLVIFVSITAHILQNDKVILTALRTFGANQNVSKRHLRKFNGIPKEHFELYLKECKWRFNHGEIKVQISILKQFSILKQLVKQNLF